jgi:adenylosuccinate synthase
MLINQAVESARGNSRHGSCGVGINETVVRSSDERFRIIVDDLQRPVDLIERLLLIRAEYVPARMAALGIATYDIGVFDSDLLLNNFVEAATDFVGTSELCGAGRLADANVIFEGSQGLLLDEVNGQFPHVTRARTGLTNVCTIANENGLGRVDVTYVSRSYMTRHGAGPFEEARDLRFEDPTNAPNPWQGTMRFGHMDLQKLSRGITHDLGEHESIVNSVTLAVTWADKIAESSRIKTFDGWRDVSRPRFVAELISSIPAHRLLLSFNPTRAGVTEKRNLGVAA